MLCFRSVLYNNDIICTNVRHMNLGTPKLTSGVADPMYSCNGFPSELHLRLFGLHFSCNLYMPI